MLLPSVLWLWDLYEKLDTERQVGMGLGQIPHSAVVAEGLRLGLGDDGLHELWFIIHGMDAVAMGAQSDAVGGDQSGRLQDKDSSRPVRSGRRKPKG